MEKKRSSSRSRTTPSSSSRGRSAASSGTRSTSTRSTATRKAKTSARGTSASSARGKGAASGKGATSGKAKTTKAGKTVKTGKSASSSAKGSSRSGSSARTSPRKTPASKRAGPGATPRGSDAIALLTRDHREVQKLFKQAERMDADQQDELQAIVQSACQALTLHAEIEEQIYYPAVEAALDEDDADLMREARIEHQSAKDLIATLEGMSPGDENYKATFKVLGEYVNHHVEEEETEMFPKSRRLVDVKALGQQILAAKQQAAPNPAGSNGRMTPDETAEAL